MLIFSVKRSDCEIFFSCYKMRLELNELLGEFYSWKNLLKTKDEEIASLQKKLSFTLKQNETLENSRANLFQEVSKLNGVISSLRNAFVKIEVFEEERKIFLEEKQKLKSSLESLEKLYHDQDKSLKLELQKVKEANREETTKLIHEIQTKASKQVDSLKVELEKKENEVHELKKEINKFKKENEQDILKLKIEYEDKIGKLKQQIPKLKLQPSHGVQMHDIFRQKYLKLERESEEEIFKLKEQIKSLKLLTESLRAKSGCTSLSAALLTTNKQSSSTTAEVHTQTEDLSLLKLDELHDEDFDITLKKKKPSKNQSVVVPQKRKLFNLNNNYYTK